MIALSFWVFAEAGQFLAGNFTRATASNFDFRFRITQLAKAH
jgi:hypothetical protein